MQVNRQRILELIEINESSISELKQNFYYARNNNFSIIKLLSDFDFQKIQREINQICLKVNEILDYGQKIMQEKVQEIQVQVQIDASQTQQISKMNQMQEIINEINWIKQQQMDIIARIQQIIQNISTQELEFEEIIVQLKQFSVYMQEINKQTEEISGKIKQLAYNDQEINELVNILDSLNLI